jgi:FSR family fosmidomycin resistance protein-like MFS transporter
MRPMTEKRSILGLSAAHLVTDLYTPVLPAILPLLILEYGYPYFIAGLIVTVFQITSSILQPVVGWLYDTRGLTVHISYTVLLSAVFISIIGFIHSYIIIVICAAVGGLAHALFHPSALGTVSRLTKDGTRGRLTSYFVVGGNLGFAIGPVIAGVVVGLFGLSGLGLLVIPGLCTAAILWRTLPVPQSLPREGIGSTANRRVTAAAIAIAILVIASAFRSWAIFASIAYFPTYLTQKGLDVVAANALVSGMLFAGVFGQVVGGTLSDHYGRKEYTLIGLLASLPPLYLFLHAEGMVAAIALILFGFCLWSTFSVSVAMAHEMMPQNVGLVSGLMLGLAVGSGGMGVAATGYIADLLSLETALSFTIIPIIGAAVLFFILPYPWGVLRRKTKSPG